MMPNDFMDEKNKFDFFFLISKKKTTLPLSVHSPFAYEYLLKMVIVPDQKLQKIFHEILQYDQSMKEFLVFVQHYISVISIL